MALCCHNFQERFWICPHYLETRQFRQFYWTFYMFLMDHCVFDCILSKKKRMYLLLLFLCFHQRKILHRYAFLHSWVLCVSCYTLNLSQITFTKLVLLYLHDPAILCFLHERIRLKFEFVVVHLKFK